MENGRHSFIEGQFVTKLNRNEEHHQHEVEADLPDADRQLRLRPCPSHLAGDPVNRLPQWTQSRVPVDVVLPPADRDQYQRCRNSPGQVHVVEQRLVGEANQHRPYDEGGELHDDGRTVE